MVLQLPQTDSTYLAILSAIGAEDSEVALDRLKQYIQETNEPRELFPRFVDRATRYLLDAGVGRGLIDREERALSDLLDTAYDAFDLAKGWVPIVGSAERAAALMGSDWGGALELVRDMHSLWLDLHDRVCDQVFLLLTIGARELGEATIGDMWDAMIGDMYESRLSYDLGRRSWSVSAEILLEDAAVSLRGHMSGRNRTGEATLEELEDRWILKFEPCGSGGRMFRRDVNTDCVARADPPYSFSVTTSAHDWAWNTEGVCLYCVHCCQLQQRVPIKMLGYPVRVIEPPVSSLSERKGRCSWSIYKHPDAVPEDAFRSVGERSRFLG